MDAEDLCQFIYNCITYYEDNLPDNEESIVSNMRTFDYAEIESKDEGLVVKNFDGETFHIIVRKK